MALMKPQALVGSIKALNLTGLFLRDNKTKEIERLNGIYGNLLSNAGVELISGYASFVDAHTVMVDA